jgi:hypothetical protein
MATFYEYDCGNGLIWKIPIDTPVNNTRRKAIITIRELSETEDAIRIMHKFYASKQMPVPQWEEDFAQGMLETERSPPPPSPPENKNEDEIPPMPAYGTQEFFVWCRKTKKAREALKAKKLEEKAEAKEAKEAAKAKKNNPTTIIMKSH